MLPAERRRRSAPVQRGLRGGDELTERRRLAHREVGKHLAVEVDVGRLQAGDESRVRDAVLATRRVDAHDPQATELAFARPAVAVRVLERVHHLLVRLAEVTSARARVALRLFEDRPAVLLAADGTLHPCHGPPPRLRTTEQSLDVLLVAAGDLRAAAEP